jgi:hypothetical protein
MVGFAAGREMLANAHLVGLGFEEENKVIRQGMSIEIEEIGKGEWAVG